MLWCCMEESRKGGCIKSKEVREGEQVWQKAAPTLLAHVPVTELCVCLWGWAMALMGASHMVPTPCLCELAGLAAWHCL